MVVSEDSIISGIKIPYDVYHKTNKTKLVYVIIKNQTRDRRQISPIVLGEFKRIN